MTKNECFNLLGLPNTANEQEIRKQYKKMAMRLHPDVNPDPKAHEAFVLLSKAVQILLDPDYKDPITERKTTRKATSETPEERLERMKVAKERYEYQRKQQQADNHSYFLSLTTGFRWKIYQLIAFTSLFVALAMSTEYFLPVHYENDVFVGYTKSKNNGIIKDNITKIQLEKRGNYYAQLNPYAWYSSYPEVQIETTWFLHTPIKMISHDDFKRYRTLFDFHLGSIQFLLIPLFLVPMVPYLWRRKKLWFVFLYQLSFWGISLLLCYMLLTQNRFVHLLTLGFY